MEFDDDMDAALARARADMVAWWLIQRALCFGSAILCFVLGTAWLVIGVISKYGQALGFWDYFALAPAATLYVAAVVLLWNEPGEVPND